MNKKAMLAELNRNDRLKLPRIDSWQTSAHSFDQNQRDAVEAAVLAGRPLLVRGEPGLGKSQIARALASAWKWRLVTAVIHSRTEVEELLYQVDHVGRLSDANRRIDQTILDTVVEPTKLDSVGGYIQCGPIWRALQEHRVWPPAESSLAESSPSEQTLVTKTGYPTGEGSYEVTGDAGCVLLIDEIDKAHSDVPNALLEVLNSGEFTVPQTGETIRAEHGVFIVVTANDERSLPAAFMRRCAVLELTLGQDPKQRLIDIAQSHVAEGLLGNLQLNHIKAVAQFVIDYRSAVPDTHYKPGTSEMLDVLRVLNEYEPLTEDDLKSRLNTLGKFLVRKGFSGDTNDSDA